MTINNAKLSVLLLFCFIGTGLHCQTMVDIEGSVYKIVTIGTQTWMAENLRTTRFNDAHSIQQVTNADAWLNRDSAALMISACYRYENDTANADIYGLIYNGFAIKTGKLCPASWHVPSDNEWSELTSFLGGEEVAGGKMKETGTDHWEIPNEGASNETGFSALPGGYRNMDGKFYYINGGSGWWSSTEYDNTHLWSRGMHSVTKHVSRGANEIPNGLYVRCIMD